MSVYFIQAGRYFKIGLSDDPARRFDKLHRSGTRYTFPADAPTHPDSRTLYKVVDGDEGDERRIHLALDDFSVGLEWFLDEPELRAFIDALPAENLPRSLDRVERPAGWCEAEYDEVQAGRAEREVARYQARRAAA